MKIINNSKLAYLTTCILLIIMVIMFACSLLKGVAKTANDVAREYCEDHVMMSGYKLSPEDWCGIQENIQPFVDLFLLNESKMMRESGEKK